MLSDLEIYRAAHATISRYGDGAGLHAAQRADERMASSWDDPSVPTLLTKRARPLEVLRIARTDIETPAILETKGKCLAGYHGIRRKYNRFS